MKRAGERRQQLFAGVWGKMMYKTWFPPDTQSHKAKRRSAKRERKHARLIASIMRKEFPQYQQVSCCTCGHHAYYHGDWGECHECMGEGGPCADGDETQPEQGIPAGPGQL